MVPTAYHVIFKGTEPEELNFINVNEGASTMAMTATRRTSVFFMLSLGLSEGTNKMNCTISKRNTPTNNPVEVKKKYDWAGCQTECFLSNENLFLIEKIV